MHLCICLIVSSKKHHNYHVYILVSTQIFSSIFVFQFAFFIGLLAMSRESEIRGEKEKKEQDERDGCLFVTMLITCAHKKQCKRLFIDKSRDNKFTTLTLHCCNTTTTTGILSIVVTEITRTPKTIVKNIRI
jgi:Mg2+/citrate symporter